MLKSGIVGMGFIGPLHIESLRRTAKSEVIAVADVNEELVCLNAERLGVPHAYTDYRDLIANPDIDVVHICAPNYLHYSIAKEALLAGKHVICEKPLVVHSDQARELVALAKEKGRVAVTSFNLRFYPLVQQARAMVQKGELGTIYAYHGCYLQDWLLFEKDYTWRLDSSISGTSRAVADIGSHWLDMAEFILDKHVTSLCADIATFLPTRRKPVGQVLTFGNGDNSCKYEDVAIDTEDYASLLFRFEDGIRGSLTVNQMSAGRKNMLEFEIDGAREALCWNSENPNELWVGHRERYNEVLIKDPNLMVPEAKGFAFCPGGHAEGYPDTIKQLFAKVYDYIYREAYRTDEKPTFPTFEDGYREVKLCEAILKSSQERAWIDV